MKYQRAFVVFLIFLTSTAAIAEEQNLQGYGRTKWGMTLSQVLAVEDRAKEQIPAGVYAGDLISRAIIPAVNIDGSVYKVLYLFSRKEGALKQVNLVFKGEYVYSGSYYSMQRLLVAKYGTPKLKQEEGASMRSRWIVGQTVVELSLVILSSIRVRNLFITYQPLSSVINNASDL